MALFFASPSSPLMTQPVRGIPVCGSCGCHWPYPVLRGIHAAFPHLRPLSYPRRRLSLGNLIRAIRLVELAKLALNIRSMSEKELCQFNGVLFRVCLKNSKAPNKLLGLCERPVRHNRLAVGFSNAGAGGAWHASLHR